MFVRRAARTVRGLLKRGSEQTGRRELVRAVGSVIEAMEGRVLLSATSYDIGEAVVTLGDGSIVVGGTSYDPAIHDRPRIALAKYAADGALQSVSVLDIAGFVSEMALDSSGRIVAVGTVGSEFAVMRFTAELGIDASFGGGDGIAVAFESSSQARDLVIQPDGKIVATGDAMIAEPFGIDIGVARFLENGDLDTSFDVDGMATADMQPLTGVSDSFESGTGAALDASGRIVVAATVPVDFEGDTGFGLVRFTDSGALDESFGSGGRAVANLSPGYQSDQVADVHVLPDGKIVVAGTSYYQSDAGIDSVALARFVESGSLDTSFGSGFVDGNTAVIAPGSGISIHLLDTEPLDDGLPLKAEAKSLAIAGDRFIVAATVRQTNGTIAGETEVGLFGFTSDGYRDSTFGEDGDLHPGVYLYDTGDLSAPDWHEQVRGMAVTPTQILVTGKTANASPDDFLLVQFGLNGVPGDTGGVNQPPIGSAGGPYLVDEGASVLLTASGSDPEDGANVTYAWDLDDDGIFETAGQSVSFTPAMGGPATLTLNVQITDSAGDSSMAAAQITVNNIAPSATIDPVAGPLPEGSSLTLVGSATDPGGDSVSLNWSIVGPNQSASGTGSSITFVPADNGNYTVTLTASDGEGGEDIEVLALSIGNVAPTLDAGPDQIVDEAGTVTVNAGPITDPGADTHTVRWELRDFGGVLVGSANGSSVVLDLPDDAEYMVTFIATDDDGGVGSDSVLVRALNKAPVVDAGPDLGGVEGALVSVSMLGATDVPADTITGVSWQVSNGTLLIAAGAGSTANFLPADNGTYTVTFTATDDDGGIGSDSLLVAVANASPVASLTRSDNDPVVRQWEVTLAGSFTDAGAADSHALAWQVMDAGGLLVASGSNGNVRFTPVSSGTHTVAFTVTDDDGGGGTADVTIDVVSAAIVNNVLRVGGTSLTDDIDVEPTVDGSVRVLFAGVSAGVFAPANGVILRGGRAADDVTVASGMPRRTTVYGGAGSDLLSSGNSGDMIFGEGGNDSLLGSGGSDVLVGGDGNDLVVGGKGDDLLIGGHGEDRLVGNQHDDVIVGGWTIHDQDLAQLSEILRTWRSRVDYQSGVAALRVEDKLLEDVTVFDDAARDVMTGEGGRDTFYGNFDKPGVLDVITDLKASEFESDLDLIEPLEL